jgi:Fur family transcriptional regulator, peroxide stress response regulator
MKSDGKNNQLNERLATTGLRLTAHRQHVYDALLQKQDHPTAEEVFLRAKQTIPDISIATVYNCLDALVKCNLVRQVNVDRGASRYCPNMKEHSHFVCEECGGVYDIERSASVDSARIKLPEGFKLKQFEISFRGTCPACSETRASI